MSIKFKEDNYVNIYQQIAMIRDQLDFLKLNQSKLTSSRSFDWSESEFEMRCRGLSASIETLSHLRDHEMELVKSIEKKNKNKE